MSTRILVGDALWGLIACHHRTAFSISFEMRSIFEMLSNIVSAKITTLQSSVIHGLDMKLKEHYKNLIEEAYRGRNFPYTLLNGTPDLLTLFNAQGAAVSNRGKITSKGLVPSEEKMRELILRLHTKELKNVFATDNLSSLHEEAEEFQEICSGILVIPIDYKNDQYVFIFRPEVVQVINWGGNPHERIHFEKDQKNYHPRNSFRLWQEKVRGTSLPWREEEVSAAENLRSFIYEYSN
jgi:two-component system, chemotaxis family, sensor kinase Cph1